jgi:hypothetical protein
MDNRSNKILFALPQTDPQPKGTKNQIPSYIKELCPVKCRWAYEEYKKCKNNNDKAYCESELLVYIACKKGELDWYLDD